jgi:hypothetical protein
MSLIDCARIIEAQKEAQKGPGYETKEARYCPGMEKAQ